MLKVFSHIMRPENRDGEGECYQVNKNIQAIYSDEKHRLESLKIKMNDVEDDAVYTLCLQGYHAKNSEKNIGLTNEELLEDGISKVMSTSVQDILEEYLRYNQNLSSKVTGRLQYIR